MNLLDATIAAVLVPAAVAILISGIDDLTLNAVCLFDWLRRRWRATQSARPSRDDLRAISQKRVAVFVPCWQESPVIAHMVEHNAATIDYQSYDFFIGAYPNDPRTIEVVKQLETRFSRVHLATCPHDGPTSKADCLNWIYQRMLLFEEEHGARFDVVVTHDAEDLIHPESLLIINFHILNFDMVQIPVLPLQMAWHHLVHGVYCDEFAEFQFKDMRARAIMGSFIPSNGVGTGYARLALERLAEAESNRIFDPRCLTEDYENGMRLHQLGSRQTFVTLDRVAGEFVATREFFPSSHRAAINQRTRWVTGIALQSWERHGWWGPPARMYWYWRDRKGLLGNPLSFATNLLFLGGVISWLTAWMANQPWGLAQYHVPKGLLAATLTLQVVHASVRMFAVSRVYGWLFAMLVPLRLVTANYINAIAAFRAVFRYTRARIKHEPLVWVKTAHAYPTRTALMEHKRRLSEILVRSGYVEPEQLAFAVATKPAGMRIGEHLVMLGILSEDHLYEALSLQQSVPSGHLDRGAVSIRVARALPLEIARKWKVLPYRVASGDLYIASPEIPSDEMNCALRGLTRMQLRFQLITPTNFNELALALLEIN